MKEGGVVPSRQRLKQGQQQALRRDPSGAPNFILPFLASLVLIYLASAHASFKIQAAFSFGLVLILLFVKLFRNSRAARVVLLSVSTFIILRYLFWRTLYTVEFTDWVSFTCAIILFLAELYGITVALIGNFVNIHPIDRTSAPLPEDEALYPTVDVMIPTYNEAFNLVETTVLGAIQMRYPAGKMNVYLLDDGGTEQKCQKGTVESIEEARKRRATLQAFCEEVGATYITRPANRQAKAGNINEAMAKTKGDLIVILDADHVPTTDFLEKTVGFFLEDPKLFLVQTPHFLINPDPVERNLDTFQKMPGENDMFYREIQRGLDFWNSAFFCGSGAVMRRRIMETIGGISTSSITEDAETALILHSRGYHSVYLVEPLISGLAAETMSGFISQRCRWAQGMIQIFLLKCPLFLPGLTLSQRICYFNSCFFWAFPFARLVYMLAPAAFLIFGLRIYAAHWQTFFAYSIPYLLAMTITTQYLFGRSRWSFVSELYELIQSMHTVPAILATLIKPRSPVFKVTPKQETLEEDFISPVAWPFYALAFINFFAMGGGVYQYLQGGVHIYPLTITLFWSVFNLVILIAALGALFERRQVRSTPRMDVDIPAEMLINGTVLPCRIENISLGGSRLFFPWGSEGALESNSSGVLRALPAGEETPVEFHVGFRNYRDEADSGFTLGVSFHPQSLQERKDKVRFVTGDSQRWADIQERRVSSFGVFRAFLSLIGIGMSRFVPHLDQIVLNLFGRKKKKAPTKTPVPAPAPVSTSTQTTTLSASRTEQESSQKVAS